MRAMMMIAQMMIGREPVKIVMCVVNEHRGIIEQLLPQQPLGLTDLLLPCHWLADDDVSCRHFPRSGFCALEYQQQ